MEYPIYVIVSEYLIVSYPRTSWRSGWCGFMLVLLACGLAQSLSDYGNEYIFAFRNRLYLDLEHGTRSLMCLNISRSETKTAETG